MSDAVGYLQSSASGAERIVHFSGLKIKTVAVVVEIY